MRDWSAYWHHRHTPTTKTYLGRASVKYAGGAIRGIQYSVDVRRFIARDGDAVLLPVLRAILGRDTLEIAAMQAEHIAEAAHRWVAAAVQYRTDMQTRQLADHWQPPEKTLAVRAGDCEDGAILIASLCRAGGIPAWRIRVAIAEVREPGGALINHAFAVYCRGADWVALDWSVLPDAHIPIIERQALHERTEVYVRTLWSFNDEHAYAHAHDARWQAA